MTSVIALTLVFCAALVVALAVAVNYGWKGPAFGWICFICGTVIAAAPLLDKIQIR